MKGLVALAVISALLATAGQALGAVNDTTLASRATGAAGAKGNGNSTTTRSSVSGNGRYVAFASKATNLDPLDTDATLDVYVRDLQAGTTTLVSRATGAGGAKGNGDSFQPSISTDGTKVAFRSAATNLDPDAGAGTGQDIYVRDLTAGTTTLVSRASGVAGADGDATSLEPSISGDGTKVAFHSGATNFGDGATSPHSDVYVRDLIASTTTLASRAAGVAGDRGNVASTSSSISADGTKVAFQTSSTNFDPDDLDSAVEDIYVRDLTAGTTTLVSRATGALGAKGNGPSVAPEISADGTKVAFATSANNFDPSGTFGGADVYVRDLAAGTTALVSRATGAAGVDGNSGSHYPSISADGTKVAFDSSSTNLDPASTDTHGDVYVRDLTAGTTTLASRAGGAAGVEANFSALDSAMAGDGTAVAFHSSSNNLNPSDTDLTDDVFVREVGAGAQHTLTVGKSGSGSGTVTSAPQGIACGATCVQAFSSGTNVTLTASAASGSAFAGWSGGGCSGTGICQVTLSADRNVTATFNQIPPPGPPGTRITKVKVSSGKRTATFNYVAIGAATGFECSLATDRKPPKFKKCADSGRVYRKLEPGNYTFQVRALNAAGSDPTPAQEKFKIKKPTHDSR